MSDSEDPRSSSVSESELESSGEEIEVGIPRQPYQNEPLAPDGYEEVDGDEDMDGLAPAILERRFQRHITVDQW